MILKNKYAIILTTIIISLMLTSCVQKIAPDDSTEFSKVISDLNEEEMPVTETFEETTTQEVRISVEPGERDSEYEKDIVFVGDSICKGLRAYSGLLKETQVFAEGSVASWSFYDYKFTINGGQYSGVEAIKRCQPKYIYVWIGMNDARYTNKDTYTQNLKKITDDFLKVSPHTKIVIVSITPICSFHKWYEDYANGVTKDDPNVRINNLNQYTQKYFEGLNDDTYSYLNVHDLLIDENGYLKEEYHSGDGLHLKPNAYNIILGAIAQNEVRADSEYVSVTPSFPYIETTAPETTTKETEETKETKIPEINTDETLETVETQETHETRPIADTVAE